MFNKTLNQLIIKLILFYIFFFYGRLNFKLLLNLNFQKIDYVNYDKIKNLIFKPDFFKIEKNSIVQNFDFINLCTNIGGKRGIEIAKKNIFGWYRFNKFNSKFIWNPEIIANRIINIVYNYNFINSISTKKDQRYLEKIIKVHIKAFNKFTLTKKFENYSLTELKVFILIKFFNSEDFSNIENNFTKIVDRQIDSFSMHKSYNILDHSKFINHLNEIINILLFLNIGVPKIFEITKIKMEAVLAQYFHKDGTIALFNGSNNNNLTKIIGTFAEKQNLKKIQFPDETNGIYFFEDKNKKLFFDTVQPTSSILSKKLSAGTLSFELSAEKEKLITNCGAIEKSGDNASYLRYSAAHSTVVLENTNISEIRENQPHIKFPQTVSFKKQENEGKYVLEGSHNGYVKNYKKIVKRKIFFEENKNYLVGEDSIISATSLNREIVYHIRFHIIPGITITETNSKKNIILKTKKNIVWMFKSNKDLNLEESVFMDKNVIKETKQIVIKGVTKQNREGIKWSIQKM
tara:strand:- start:6657 stop:8207 length:1551 start_codon:yes stop_codon:yes gene_type:complete